MSYIDGVAWVGVLESAGDGNGRAGGGAAAAGYGDLSAGDIELRDARGPGVVDAQGLDAEEVVAVGNAGRDDAAIAA